MIKKMFYVILAIGLVVGNPWMVSLSEAATGSGSSIETIVIGTTTYTVNFKCSSGVTISYATGDATLPNSFNAVSWHSKGDKSYGMESDGGPVYFVNGTSASVPAAQAGTGDFGSPWSTI